MPPKKEDEVQVDAASPAEVAAPAAAESDAAAPDAANADAPEAAAEEVPQAPLHTALLDHDDPDASAFVAGLPVVRGENGLFLVPLALVAELQPHGYRVVSEGR